MRLQFQNLRKHDLMSSFSLFKKISMCKGELIYDTIYKIYLPLGKAAGVELSIAQSIMKLESQCKPTACQKKFI